MTKVDRRILKSQEAIKNAFMELMSEKDFDKITVKDICNGANVGNRTFYLHYLDKFDLLDKLIEEHLAELKVICQQKKDKGLVEGSIIWFEYFEQYKSFFSPLFSSNGTITFRNRFLHFVIEEIKEKVDFKNGKNKGISEKVFFRFLGMAIIGVMELYMLDATPESTDSIAEQVSILLERNL
ncbi:TetR/AcrR family transcriptional regulator [Peribacillus aracenensis]|uniref:TetR/AcrR family transcriptional regulator n=1 Tax=Peribacillus aracenensis TaxID=2976708 RepID=UPI0021A30D6E|nr:TetR/AcrR family transcriptional regulator [Peribacillus sp. BBB004]